MDVVGVSNGTALIDIILPMAVCQIRLPSLIFSAFLSYRNLEIFLAPKRFLQSSLRIAQLGFFE
jgi:hypothetical protein